MTTYPNYDCVLISPPSRSINHYRPPLSLIYLGGYLKQKGLNVKIIDYTLPRIIRNAGFYENVKSIINEAKEYILFEIKQYPTDYIGISCYSPEFEEIKELIKSIQEISKAKIIVGGIHPTLKPKDFKGLAHTIIQGEGEVALYEVISQKKSGIIKADVHPIEAISYPDYNLVDMEYYTNANPYAIRGCFLRTTYLLASRGCPSQCSFCVAPALKDFTHPYRMRNPYSLVEEIRKHKEKYHIDAFYFIDDTFTLYSHWVELFCKLIKDEKIVWGCSSKITSLSGQLLKTMSEANCIQLDLGVERGSDEELLRIKKYQTIEKIKEIFRQCQEYKIRTFSNMLVNIPGEKYKDYEDIRNLLDEIKPTVVSVNVFKGYLGVDLPDKEPLGWVIIWANLMNQRYNSILKAIQFHFSLTYFRIILSSKRKLNYLKQVYLLVREAINQKW